MSKEIHESSNLAFVAALVCYGAEILKADKSDPRRTIFNIDVTPIDRVFVLEGDSVEARLTSKSGTYETLLNLFVSDKLLLMPNYMAKVKDLKSLIHG